MLVDIVLEVLDAVELVSAGVVAIAIPLMDVLLALLVVKGLNDIVIGSEQSGPVKFGGHSQLKNSIGKMPKK